MKVMLDYLGMDRPTNSQLRDLGSKLNFYPGLPEMFSEFQSGLLAPDHEAHGIVVEHYIISSGIKVLIEGSRLAPFVKAIFGCEFAEGRQRPHHLSAPRDQSHAETQYLFRINKGMLDMSPGRERSHARGASARAL